MGTKILAPVIIILCVCALTREARAQVNVQNGTQVLDFYSPPRIAGWVGVNTDYSTQVYYCTQAWVNIINENTSEWNLTTIGPIMNPDPTAGACDGNLWATTDLAFDPAAEYSSESATSMNIEFRSQDGVFADPYNYLFWQNDQDPFSFPLSFGFFGPGPERSSPESYIYLGEIFSFYSQGSEHGPPHHLKMLDDKIEQWDHSDGRCGQKVRLAQWQVVDAQGRGAGKIAVGESAPNGLGIDPCNGQQVRLTPCSVFAGGKLRPTYTDRKGKFPSVDRLHVGCPSPHDDCGVLTDPLFWSWCKPPDFTSIREPLAKLQADVRKNRISINGRDTPWPKNTQFFADGSVRLP
jgi:hypothetical protein